MLLFLLLSFIYHHLTIIAYIFTSCIPPTASHLHVFASPQPPSYPCQTHLPPLLWLLSRAATSTRTHAYRCATSIRCCTTNIYCCTNIMHCCITIIYCCTITYCCTTITYCCTTSTYCCTTSKYCFTSSTRYCTTIK